MPSDRRHSRLGSRRAHKLTEWSLNSNWGSPALLLLSFFFFSLLACLVVVARLYECIFFFFNIPLNSFFLHAEQFFLSAQASSGLSFQQISTRDSQMERTFLGNRRRNAASHKTHRWITVSFCCVKFVAPISDTPIQEVVLFAKY